MICCRYIKFVHWLSTVEYGRFKVSKPSDFEDKYDCAACADGEIELDVIKKFSNSFLDDLESINIQDAVEHRCVSDVYVQRQQSFKSHFNHLLLRRNVIDQYLRVLCFFNDSNASAEDRYKMWEKYGDAFKGVRVFVDLDKVIGGEYKEITYAESIPCCNLSRIVDFPICSYLIKFYKDMVFTKLRGEWGFENEIRYIWGVADCKQHQILHADGNLEFVSIPLYALVRVDFGCEVNLDDYINDVRRLAGGVHHNHIEFRRLVGRSGNDSAYAHLLD